MKLIGLTGGISCGKSTISSLLKQLEIPVIDCDEIAHDVVRKVRAKEALDSASLIDLFI